MSYSRRQRFGHKKKIKGKALMKVAMLLLLIVFVTYTYRTVGLITALQGKDGYFEKSLNGRENYMVTFVDKQISTTFIISMDEAGPAYYINIPNNTRVDSNNQKILLTDLYKESGKDGLISAVNNLLNETLPISGYVILEKQGLENLVDALDGLSINIKNEIVEVGSLILIEGERKLLKDSAITYFSYVDPQHPESFMERQVETLQTVFNDYFKWSRSISLLSGLTKIEGYFDTNMSIRELAWFRNMLDETSDREKYITTIPGTTETFGTEAMGFRDFWVIDSDRVVTFTNNINTNNSLFYKEDISIEVLNGNGVAGIAGRYGAMIAELGFNDVQWGNADRSDYPQTIIKYFQDYRHIAEEILAAMDVDGELQQTQEGKNITIILGKDIN